MPPKVRVISSRGIARAAMRQGSVTRREFIGRANLAAYRFYNKKGYPPPRRFKYENEDHPFNAKRHQKAVGSAKVIPHRDRVDIVVTAPSAEFVERGTGPGPVQRDDGGLMYIPIKRSKTFSKKGGRTRYIKTRKGDVKLRVDQRGRFVLAVRRVRPFVGGYRRLRRSVETAFRRR